MTNNITKHSGGCHCGAVRFTVEVDASQGSRCNCTFCTKIAQTGAITKPDAIVVTQGEDALSTYPNSVGARYFCKHCGIHCFGRGSLVELGGEFASVNLHCLDGLDPAAVQVVYWDGRHDNWHAGPRPTPWPVHAEVSPAALVAHRQ